MLSPLPRRAAVAIVLLALVVRLAAGFWWQSHLPPGERFFFGDSDSYWTLGERLARGQTYEYEPAEARVFRTPGYPLLLAAMFRLVGTDPPVMCGRALSAVLGAMAVALTIGWAGWLFDARTGLVAGSIAALYPGAMAMGVFVLSEAAFCPLMIAQLWLWGAASRCQIGPRRLLFSAGAGVAAGLATLVRPSWLLFTPFAWSIAVVFSHRRKEQFMAGLVVTLLMALVLTPWWVRNAIVIGRFVPTTLQVGASLYDGLNPDATGASDMRFVPHFRDQLRAADAAGAATTDDPLEYRLDQALRREAHRPGPRRIRAVCSNWRSTKLVRLWNVWPNEREFRGWDLRLVVLATYLPVLLAGFWGAGKFTAAGWAYVVAWMPAVYLTLLHTVFVSSIRYREPAMLALTVLAAGAITTHCCRTRMGTAVAI